DDGDAPVDVIDALALSPFATGAQPWARSKNLERVLPDASLMPRSGRLLRVACEEGGRDARLVVGDGWTLRVIRYRNRSALVSVCAVSEELAQAVLAETVEGAAEPTPETDHVEMGFWWQTAHGGRRSDKPISASPW